jgi:hypothetical protein
VIHEALGKDSVLALEAYWYVWGFVEQGQVWLQLVWEYGDRILLGLRGSDSVWSEHLDLNLMFGEVFKVEDVTS